MVRTLASMVSPRSVLMWPTPDELCDLGKDQRSWSPKPLTYKEESGDTIPVRLSFLGKH